MKNVNLFEGKSRTWYLSLIGSALSLIAAIIYLIYALSVNLFYAPAFVFMLLGGLSFAATASGKLDFAALLSSVLCALGFGIHLFDRVEMFAYMASGIYGMGEKGAILWVVVLILALSLLATILNLVASFGWQRKRDEEVEKQTAPVRRSKKGWIAIGAAAAVVVVAGLILLPGTQEPAVVELTGIQISTKPAKCVYSIQDFFSPDGMVVSALYSDGTSGQVTGYDVDLHDALTEDITKVTVTYMGFKAECPIEVKEITSAQFTGNGASVTLMEHGVAWVKGSSAEPVQGTWANAGTKILVNVDGAEYEAVQTESGYTLNLPVDGQECVLTSGPVELLLGGEFTGTSLAGAVAVTLNADGTLFGSFGGIPVVGENWRKEGMSIIMNVHISLPGMFDTQQECVATKVNGVYATTIKLNMGYTLDADVVFAEAK